MDPAEERPALHRLGSLLVAVALVPGMVGFATEYWLLGNGPYCHIGLWKACSDTGCRSLQTEDLPDWFGAVRGMSVMALCLHIMSVVTGCCCVFLEDHEHNVLKIVGRLEEVASVLAGALVSISLVVFALSSREHPVFYSCTFDWSFWITLAELCLLLIGGVFVTLSRRDCSSRKNKCQRRTSQGHRKNSRRLSRPSPVYRQVSAEQKRVPVYNIFNSASITNSVPPKKADFFAKLKSSERILLFSSLEGIPRMLQKLSDPNKDKDQSGVA